VIHTEWFTLSDLHWVIYTEWFTLSDSHWVIYTEWFTLRDLHWGIHTEGFTLCDLHWVTYTEWFYTVIYTEWFTLSDLHWVIYTEWFTLSDLHWVIYTVIYTEAGMADMRGLLGAQLSSAVSVPEIFFFVWEPGTPISLRLIFSFLYSVGPLTVLLCLLLVKCQRGSTGEMPDNVHFCMHVPVHVSVYARWINVCLWFWQRGLTEEMPEIVHFCIQKAATHSHFIRSTPF